MVSNTAVAGELLRFFYVLFPTLRRPAEEARDLKTNSHACGVLLGLYDGREGEPYTMSRLAREASISKQQLTKLVGPLEQRGLVRRRQDAANRRQVIVSLTDEGAAQMEKLFDSVADRMDVYTEEEKREFLSCVATFQRLLGKLDKSRGRESR